MFCSKCGVKNNDTNKFCPNCGNNLISNNVNKTNSDQETSLVLGIICLVSSFFLNVLCFIPGIISIVYAKKYKKESGKLGAGFGLSLAGMIYSFLMFLLFILLFVYAINFVDDVGSELDYTIEPNYTYYLPNMEVNNGIK